MLKRTDEEDTPPKDPYQKVGSFVDMTREEAEEFLPLLEEAFDNI